MMIRSSRRAWLMVLAVGLLLLLPLPRGTRTTRAILDLAHAPAAGLVALALLHLLRGRLPRAPGAAELVVWLVTSGLGAAMELVQGQLGREASWQDALTNALGAGAFLLLARPTRLRVAAGVALLLAAVALPGRVLVDTVQQHQAMPMLSSLEAPFEMTRWIFQDADGERVEAHASHGERSLRVDLHAARYPGASLAAPVGDWRGYTALSFDVHVGPGDVLPLVVKIEDAEHDKTYEDRFHRTFELTPGYHRLQIPLADVERGPATRRMDLGSVTVVQWFVDGLRRPRRIHLDNVKLRR